MTCVFNQGINMHTLPITSTNPWKVQFSIWFWLMCHHRFANATQVWRCKSDQYEMEKMKNKPNHTRAHTLVIFGAPNLVASPPPHTHTHRILWTIPHFGVCLIWTIETISFEDMFFFVFLRLEHIFKSLRPLQWPKVLLLAFTFLQHVPLAKLMIPNGT
jgi:hypothetical protein